MPSLRKTGSTGGGADTAPPPSTPDAPPVRGRGRTRWIAGGALAVLGLVVVGLAATGGFSSGGARASAASTSTATTTVQRRDLVEIDEESGTLGYADIRDVVNRLDGTITWLPTEGSVIDTGHTLLKVDGAEVVLLDGTVPAWRTLSPDTSDGRDVGELERNLRALGYDKDKAMTVDGSWDAGTTAAVERFQKAHGLEQTGSLDLGQVVFLPGDRRVGTIDATLGGSAAAAGAASAAGGAAPASYDGTESETRDAVYTADDAAQWRIVDTADTTTAPATATTPTTTTPTTTTPTTPATTPTTPTPTTPTTSPPTTTTPQATPTAPSTAATPQSTPAAPAGGLGAGAGASPAAGGASAPTGGGSASAGAASAASTTASTIMTTTSGRRQVTVPLPTTKQTLAKVGRAVTVELPGNTFVKGTIVSVGKVATAPASSDGASSGGSSAGASSGSTSTSATVTVKIRLRSDRGSSLDQAPVTVRFEQSRVKDALAVPVTALIAQPGGRFAVQVVSSTGQRLVPVTPGVYTSGYVQITGDVQPGTRITNASETA